MFSNTRGAIQVALLTFIVSLMISLLFQFSLAPWISILLLLFVILNGIVFDIIGTAVTAADETPFHAMGADRIRGSRQAVLLIRNADKVANFCNDVVGDISGTIGGAIIASIVVEFTRYKAIFSRDLLNAAAIATIAALTVSGKFLGKAYAINKANQIVFIVGKIIAWTKIIRLDSKKNKRKLKSNMRKARKV